MGLGSGGYAIRKLVQKFNDCLNLPHLFIHLLIFFFLIPYSAGWVQDNGGDWVKGQDVEFDSDEEPPT